MRQRCPPVLPLALLAGLAASACNPRERECDALRRATASASAAADGGAGDELTAAADRAVAVLDRQSFKVLDKPAADLRAALVTVASESRAQKAAIADAAAAVKPVTEGPIEGVSLPAEATILQQSLLRLAGPCTSSLFAGLETLFSRKTGAPPPSPPKGNPDCEALGKILAQITGVAPDTSVSTLARSCVTSLEEAKLSDPALAAPARDLAGALRRLDPVFSKLKTPAAELLAMGARLSATGERVEEARTALGDRVRAVEVACPAGK